MNRGDALRDIFRAALAAVDPGPAVARDLRLDGGALSVAGRTYDFGSFDRIVVVGAGKAAARMAAAVEDVLGDRIAEGLIIVKYGHTAPLRSIRQIEAGHPVPDAAGVGATREIMELLSRAGERTLVLCLLSGGGSALLTAPAGGLTLADKQRATELLLGCGATIEELNSVRKHLSAVKGGRLAKLAWPATVVTLLLSDVLRDRLDVIASGPTAPDESRFADALSVIRRYGLEGRMPADVLSRLERGAAGREAETPKEQDPCFARTQNRIVAGLDQAIDAAAEKARSLGMSARVVWRDLRGEARDAARKLAQESLRARERLREGETLCLVSGGETTVAIRGKGRGGRNQEFALAFALEIAGQKGTALLSAGTDGTDGPTDAAGAIVDGDTVRRAAEAGLSPAEFLADNDSYTFFERFDGIAGTRAHLKTGPTGTNVMDIQVVIVERTAPAATAFAARSDIL